ncbi:MAG TPA: twin-arginine translocase TatA/TatE family subunit [Candidatus Paceibacterota bacterium]|nr:twin-arginine translocase TatA/TatE family subunit [Verrucomicrobiota bacterium]HOX03560.1 twin-arginine translocase TatA/TatE family subunit [Verrucomicrobiota bacterium]HRZ46449.1 twin-arginine translocase TatA/TatE family subunit [Candidatus Paceibacterota bacterium]HRZ94311.1 twin-arginine translocase TatA/TatE family subunit [Candidatus Paceibacterota bacterium]
MNVLGFMGWPEMVAIMLVILLLFGAKKLPELARGLGHGIKEFKKATREVTEDLQQAIEDEPAPPRRTNPVTYSDSPSSTSPGAPPSPES